MSSYEELDGLYGGRYSQRTDEFTLKYKRAARYRSTLKLLAQDQHWQNRERQAVPLAEIDESYAGNIIRFLRRSATQLFGSAQAYHELFGGDDPGTSADAWFDSQPLIIALQARNNGWTTTFDARHDVAESWKQRVSDPHSMSTVDAVELAVEQLCLQFKLDHHLEECPPEARASFVERVTAQLTPTPQPYEPPIRGHQHGSMQHLVPYATADADVTAAIYEKERCPF